MEAVLSDCVCHLSTPGSVQARASEWGAATASRGGAPFTLAALVRDRLNLLRSCRPAILVARGLCHACDAGVTGSRTLPRTCAPKYQRTWNTSAVRGNRPESGCEILQCTNAKCQAQQELARPARASTARGRRHQAGPAQASTTVLRARADQIEDRPQR